MLSGVLNGQFNGVRIDRRELLAGAAAPLPCGVPKLSFAAAATNGQQAPGIYRYKIGNIELTASYDGVWNRPIDDKFVKNAYFPDVQKALAEAFLPMHAPPASRRRRSTLSSSPTSTLTTSMESRRRTTNSSFPMPKSLCPRLNGRSG